jgi:hypothetical protein
MESIDSTLKISVTSFGAGSIHKSSKVRRFRYFCDFFYGLILILIIEANEMHYFSNLLW